MKENPYRPPSEESQKLRDSGPRVPYPVAGWRTAKRGASIVGAVVLASGLVRCAVALIFGQFVTDGEISILGRPWSQALTGAAAAICLSVSFGGFFGALFGCGREWDKRRGNRPRKPA